MKKLAIVLGLIILFLAARAPLLSNLLVYEEGDFANIVINQPAGPAYLLCARIENRNLYSKASHPALMYEVLKIAGRVVQPWFVNSEMSNEAITVRLRALFSIFSLIIWIAISIVALKTGDSFTRNLILMLIAAVMCSPMALLTSTQLQLDGSMGVLLTGPLAIALLAVSKKMLSRIWVYPLLFSGALILGFGKQEWSIAMLCSVLLWVTVYHIMKLRQRVYPELYKTSLVAIVCGIIFGNLISFVFDPANYLGGFEMMFTVGNSSTIATGSGLFHWLKVTCERMPMLITPLLLGYAVVIAGRDRLGISGCSVSQKERAQNKSPSDISFSHACLLLFFAMMLFLGYFISGWGSDPRYFAPALIAVTAAVVAFVPEEAANHSGYIWARYIRGITIAIFLHIGVFFGYRVIYPEPYSFQVIPRAAYEGRCIPVLSTGQAWNQGNVSFISNALGFDGAVRRAGKYGKTLCKHDENFSRIKKRWSNRFIEP